MPLLTLHLLQVVTSVISALGPSIAKAVEEALAAQAAAEADAAAAAQAQAAASRRAAAARRAEEQRRQQQIAAANAAAAAASSSQQSADLGPYVTPVYNFEYKIADEAAQTYISRQEDRDGDALSGSYSFVDATGSLVKVDYTAGVEGYAETRTSEPGFVQMRAIPAWTGPLAGVEDSGAGAMTIAKTSRPSSSSFGSSSGSSSSQSDLIARILAALTPQINSAVNSAVNAQG